VYGLFFELSRPGAILPGIVGGICLILAVVAFQALPVNTAGLLLILLGLVLLLLEIKVTSFGMLAMGGVTALFLGSMLLFRGDSPLGQLSLRVVVPVVGVTAVLLLGVAGMGLRAQMTPPWSGTSAMVGVAAVVRRVDGDDGPARSGVVEISGELWSFAARRDLDVGDRVVVESVDGRTLHVRPATRDRGDES
jgi:membrane-bound serine protease (ClpP class)